MPSCCGSSPEGLFPEPAEEIDAEAVSHVARQVGVLAKEYRANARSERTVEYHRAQIREAFGFRPATAWDVDELAGWLLEEAAPREYDAERLTPLLYGHVNPYGRFDLDMNKRLPLGDVTRSG